MLVTAWNNGQQALSGAGYGLKIKVPSDIHKYFDRRWGTVSIELPNGQTVRANIDKESFWNGRCRELISRDIGQWLLAEGYAPWPFRKPPRFELVSLGGGHYKLSPL